jgi:hypothetical protein
MSKIIIYQDLDGSTCIVHPAPGVALNKVIASAVPEGVEHKVIEDDQLPQDRYFRDAWKLDAGAIAIDIEAAKEVQRNVWRKLRAPKLDALDMELMRAVEAGLSTAKRNEIADKKQALRDITTTPLPDDLEAIKNAIPEPLA